MKKLLLPVIIVCSALCQQVLGQVHLISDSILLRYTLHQLDSLYAANSLSPLTPTYPVSLHRIIYNTIDAQDSANTIASGLFVLPDSVICPLPFIVYDHGTTLTKTGVPSFLSDEAIVGVFMSSSFGYAAVEPDYLGLGVSPGFHPYIHAKSEATATIDMLRACRELCANDSIELNGQLFLTGYSQGGHACMATHREIQLHDSTEFTVTASAPNSGPYDVAGVQAQTIASGVAYADPSYLPYIIMAYNFVYENIYDSLSQVFVYPYDSTLPGLMDGTHSDGYVDGQLPSVVSQMIQPAELSNYDTDSINNPLRIDLRDNNTYTGWVPKAPMKITYCDSDQEVFHQNAMVAFNYFIANGGSGIVSIADGGPYNHQGCVTPAFTNTFLFFNNYVKWQNNLVLSMEADSESSPGAGDAGAKVIVTGGTGYIVHWSNGSTLDSIVGLHNDSTYYVTVTDSKGCSSKVDSVNTGGTLDAGIKNVTVAPSIQLVVSPNPVRDELRYDIFSIQQHVYTLELYDLQGQKLINQELQPDGGTTWGTLDVSRLSAGIYCLRLSTADKTIIQKISVVR